MAKKSKKSEKAEAAAEAKKKEKIMNRGIYCDSRLLLKVKYYREEMDEDDWRDLIGLVEERLEYPGGMAETLKILEDAEEAVADAQDQAGEAQASYRSSLKESLEVAAENLKKFETLMDSLEKVAEVSPIVDNGFSKFCKFEEEGNEDHPDYAAYMAFESAIGKTVRVVPDLLYDSKNLLKKLEREHKNLTEEWDDLNSTKDSK